MTKVNDGRPKPMPGHPGGPADRFSPPTYPGAPVLGPLNDFKRIDANHGGTITRDEWRRAGLSRQLFSAYDANSDRVISQREYLAGRRAEAEFDRKDRDRSGSLTPWEWGVTIFDRFADAAREGLDRMSDAFRSPGAPMPLDSQFWFDRADTNHDRKVSRVEFVKYRVRPHGFNV